MSETRPPAIPMRQTPSGSSNPQTAIRSPFPAAFLRFFAGLVVILVLGYANSPVSAGGLHGHWTTFGRWFGVGFGDGYHRCPGPKKGCFSAPFFAEPCHNSPHCAGGHHSAVWTSSVTPNPGVVPQVRMTRIPEQRPSKHQESKQSLHGWHHRDWPQ